MRDKSLQDRNVPDQEIAEAPSAPKAETHRNLFDRNPHLDTSKARPLAPIGVFDSGAGGLTILSALRQELPQEDYIYFGDTEHCPYGKRTETDITALTVDACRLLVEQGVKLIVVACNTASQAALQAVRATFSLPIVGVVPAVKPAARMTKNGRIGIAATDQAARSAYLRQLIADFAGDIQAYTAGCSALVTLVERGELAGPAVEQTLRTVLAPLTDQDIDVLVLGCTHFPAMRAAIEHVVGERVQVIDSAAAIARRTHSILLAENVLHPSHGRAQQGNLQVWCSGDAKHFSDVASAILGYSVVASQKEE
ncbi:glutamate racemase [Reticulibacter mediterranei]|uniref:Glutamate racemase n=1 Tax=Reticulibacter mediterranei TaxID=2778369 RepID=A0A8J3N4Q8_9CHLR|nr:glutamate racemase [Reticulibacter mediterranei]GHO94337.1 glutamate racemase [Reticulibacter mediterranei]